MAQLILAPGYPSMTRKKKTRSLSRIHNVKTGSIQKLKREAGADRQTGKSVSNKVKSVYEKFLEEHPEAREKAKTKEKKSTSSKNEAPALGARSKKPRDTPYDRKNSLKAKDSDAKSSDIEKNKKEDREENIFDRFERGGKDGDLY
ncbi:MAG: hypothetical protein P1U57_13725 [Oleibacter sp.]|nr:hypothetical protein [Thalassolituus sp.]